MATLLSSSSTASSQSPPRQAAKRARASWRDVDDLCATGAVPSSLVHERTNARSLGHDNIRDNDVDDASREQHVCREDVAAFRAAMISHGGLDSDSAVNAQVVTPATRQLEFETARDWLLDRLWATPQ